MTGIECLKQELRKLGCNKSQTESKVIPLVLGIVAGEPEKWVNIAEWQKEIEDDKKDLADREARVAQEERAAKALLEKAQAICKTTQDYIDSFYFTIHKAETPEGADKLRKAQMFVNSVTVETKYDNTAFIAGLASILAGDNGFSDGPLNTLKKINPKLAQIRSNGLYVDAEGHGVYL